MYEFIEGTILNICEKYIILYSKPFAYKVYVTNVDGFKIGEMRRLYIYFYINDNIRCIFGFADSIEREVFEQLIKVKNIGVKSAFALLKKCNYLILINYIFLKDYQMLFKLPKVTKDNVKQLISNLEKLFFFENININDQFLCTLRTLGYNDHQIFNVYKLVANEDNIDSMVKKAILLIEGELNE